MLICLRCFMASLALLFCAACQSPGPMAKNEVPLVPPKSPVASEALSSSIADQIRSNWNIGSLSNCAHAADMVATLHVHLLPDGTITNVTYANEHADDPCYRNLYESGRRALLMTRRLILPPGQSYESMTFNFRPGDLQ